MLLKIETELNADKKYTTKEISDMLKISERKAEVLLEKDKIKPINEDKTCAYGKEILMYLCSKISLCKVIDIVNENEYSFTEQTNKQPGNAYVISEKIIYTTLKVININVSSLYFNIEFIDNDNNLYIWRASKRGKKYHELIIGNTYNIKFTIIQQSFRNNICKNYISSLKF